MDTKQSKRGNLVLGMEKYREQQRCNRCKTLLRYKKNRAMPYFCSICYREKYRPKEKEDDTCA